MSIRIRFIDPVGGPQPVLAEFAEYLISVCQKGTELEVVSLATQRCSEHLEFHSYESIMASDIVRAVRLSDQQGFDAVVIGCFYDPVLIEAREISGNAVVVAPCHSSLEIVSNLANRFSVIVGRNKWVNRMQSKVSEYGYNHQLASFKSIEASVHDLQTDESISQRMIDAAKDAVSNDGAEAIVLGCTQSFGFYKELQNIIEIPVIDCALAAVKRAEQLAETKQLCDWAPSRVGSCEPPPEHEAVKVFDSGYSPLCDTVTLVK